MLSAPVLAFATDGLVPCGQTVMVGTTQTIPHPCGFNDFITLAQNIINGWIMGGVTIAAIGFAYAGFLYITAMGSEEKIHHAHAIFIKVVWGFVFMLSAWLIVKTLEDTFLRQEQRDKSFLEESPASG